MRNLGTRLRVRDLTMLLLTRHFFSRVRWKGSQALWWISWRGPTNDIRPSFMFISPWSSSRNGSWRTTVACRLSGDIRFTAQWLASYLLTSRQFSVLRRDSLRHFSFLAKVHITSNIISEPMGLTGSQTIIGPLMISYVRRRLLRMLVMCKLVDCQMLILLLLM